MVRFSAETYRSPVSIFRPGMGFLKVFVPGAGIFLKSELYVEQGEV